jgi:ferredoxin-NADP reductase
LQKDVGVPAYTSRFLQSEEIALGTMAFYFEKPEGFQFKAGQYINITLLHPPETDEEGNVRAFTLASAPFENNLMIATRMRETAFKRSLKKLSKGDEVKIRGAFGSLVLPESHEKPLVFLAGGIGITPFFSMMKESAHQKSLHEIFLFYANRKEEDAAFLKELQELEKENPNFHVIPTFTDIKNVKPTWKGETGYIDERMLSRYISNILAPLYFIAGPPAMVDAMQAVLKKSDVPEGQVRCETFDGYA